MQLCVSPLREKEEVSLGGHNDTWEWPVGGKSYYDRIAAFIQHALDFESPLFSLAPSHGAASSSSSGGLMDKASSSHPASSSRAAPRGPASLTTTGEQAESPEPSLAGDEAAAVVGHRSEGPFPLCREKEAGRSEHSPAESTCLGSYVCEKGRASPEVASSAGSSTIETAASSLAADVTGVAGSTFPEEVGSQYSGTLRERVGKAKANEPRDEL